MDRISAPPTAAPEALDRRIRASPRVTAREVEDGTVLLDLESGRYFDLDESGTRLWRRIAPGTRLDELVETLLTEFDAPRERLAEDLVAFVDQLEREGLVVADD